MGGIETVAWELVEGQSGLGLRADVLCSNISRKTESERAPSGYTVWRAGSWGRVLSTSVCPDMLRLAMQLCRQYDVIHVHMPDPMAALAMWFAKPNGALVVHWHSDVIRQRRSMALYQPLQDWLLRRADAIIATSQAYADSSEPLKPWRGKVGVIPIGISDYSAKVDSQEVARIVQRHGGRRIIFALGRMAYYKGFEFLVRAAASLPEDAVVLIGGEGEHRQPLQDEIKSLGLQSKVRLLGALPDELLPSYFAACDLFCMPSLVRAEAYGVATVEAMCLGRPVVSSDIPGSGLSWVNLNGVTGLTVAPADAAALAQALNTLLSDEALRSSLGKAARSRYEAELTASAMASRTLALYQSIVARPGLPGRRGGEPV
jgi:rhamnosyl/mannosyltransferase